MTVLVTPVGTSLFTNYLDKNPNDNAFRHNYNTIKKAFVEDWDNHRTEIAGLKSNALNFIKTRGVQASAELQSIAKIQEELNDQIAVCLLASDTIASRLAAEILKEHHSVLNDVIFNFDITSGDIINGLQVENPKVFSQEGMAKLIQRINSIGGGFVGLAITRGFAINITGGYKATVPYLTILAQLERVPLYYNFEDTDALIKIPQAPLVIDWASIERYSDVLMQIDEGIENWGQFQEDNHQAVQDLEMFIETDEEIALLSPIGQIFWNHYQKYFVSDLPTGRYFSYERTDREAIDYAVKELYERLNDTLKDSYFNPYDCIRKLGHNNDLNHGGQIPGQRIFIFKSTVIDHIRLLYTFTVKPYSIEVNGDRSEVGEITRITIFDLHCGDFDHKTYIDDWKKFGGGEPFTIDFEKREINFKKPTKKDPDNSIIIDFITQAFPIPQQSLINILQLRRQKIR